MGKIKERRIRELLSICRVRLSCPNGILDLCRFVSASRGTWQLYQIHWGASI